MKNLLAEEGKKIIEKVGLSKYMDVQAGNLGIWCAKACGDSQSTGT